MIEDGLKLTTYFGERARSGDRYLADALLDVFGRERLAVSVLLRGAEGFGFKHHRRTDRLLTLSEDLPLVAIAVDGRERVEAVLGEVLSLTRSGLVTLERGRLAAGSLGPVELAEPTKLTVYVGRGERVRGMPAYVAVTDLLRRRGVAGATVLLGVDGTAYGVRRRARFLGRNADVPTMIVAVADGRVIAPALAELGALLARPLVTLERVRVCKRDGELLARPHALPGTDEHGLALFQKLTVYGSEQARHHGRPVHQELVRRLRSRGAGGATTLRGIWGFHGDHEPHGDRLLQVRRNVPTVTVVVDRPDRIMASFAVIDELTGERGLVTSELVPASAVRPHDGLHLAQPR